MKLPFTLIVCLLLAGPLHGADVAPPIAEFEAETYGDWKATGEAFGAGPAAGTLAGQMEVTGFAGKRLVNSFAGGDRTTGTLTSPPIKLTRKYLNFLVGGGGHAGETCVNLIVDGKTVRTATGPNTQPGGSERLDRVFWDVSDLIGKTAVVEVVDKHTGGWGHINFDDLRASDEPVGVTPEELRKGPNLQTFPSYADAGYDQPLRPQFHFTSRKNWLNDPNGLVFYDGEYHLFFQHNPLGTGWGNMTWGHAVSKDMLHWTQLPHAILPYDGGTIFSGTAAVDEQNTLGVQKGNDKTLVAAFTFAKEPFGQSLAYSTDRGRTFKLLNDGKPVVPNNGYDPGERDPKIFWHAPSKKWVMVLWVKQAQPGRVLFFNSNDLRTWKEVSQFDRDWVFECMDMVELAVDGNPNKKKWLLYDASFEYEIGDFDGRTFTTDKMAYRGEYGPNFYAAQTFNNSPDGRTVIVGWMRGDNRPFVDKGMPFNLQMSFPCTLKLKTTPDGTRLFRWPIAEIESLYASTAGGKQTTLAAAQQSLDKFSAELIDFSIAFAADDKTTLTINVRGQEVKYAAGAFQYGDVRLPAPPIDGVVSLRALVDRASLELFANQGAAVATSYATFAADNQTVTLAGSADLKIQEWSIRELQSVWKD